MKTLIDEIIRDFMLFETPTPPPTGAPKPASIKADDGTPLWTRGFKNFSSQGPDGEIDYTMKGDGSITPKGTDDEPSDTDSVGEPEPTQQPTSEPRNGIDPQTGIDPRAVRAVDALDKDLSDKPPEEVEPEDEPRQNSVDTTVDMPKPEFEEKDKSLSDKVVPAYKDNSNSSRGMPRGTIEIPDPITHEKFKKLLGDDVRKIPPAYIDSIVNILNSHKNNKGWIISDYLERSGAGKPTSQAGEILSSIHMSLSKENSQRLHEFLTQKLTGKGNPNNNNSVVEKSWINASKKNGDAFRIYQDLKHGKENWEVTAMAWDVQEEVENVIGLDYSQKEHATDTFLRIKTKDGSYVEEISLKKDQHVNFLNLTTGQFEEYIVRMISPRASNLLDRVYGNLKQCDNINNPRLSKSANEKLRRGCKQKAQSRLERLYDAAFQSIGIPENLSARKVSKKQTEIHEKGLSENSNAVREMSSLLSGPEGCNVLERIDIDMSQGGVVSKDCKKLQPLFQKLSQHEGEVTLDVIRKYAKETKNKTDEKFARKISTMLSIRSHEELQSENGEKLHEVYIDARQNSFEHSEQLMDWCMNTTQGRKVIDSSIREQLPLEAVMIGRETMIIGDTHFSKEDAIEIFGTDDFSQVSERLKSMPSADPPPPGPRIEYQVEGKNENLIVAGLHSRPDGIAYGGTWKFELKLHKDFAQRIKEVNERRSISQQKENTIISRFKNILRPVIVRELERLHGNNGT